MGERQIDRRRPIIENGDGTFSTERTITIEVDGRFFNIPTIVGGRQRSEEEAIGLWRRGQNQEVGSYQTLAQAETAARQRSERIGQVRGNDRRSPTLADYLANPDAYPEVRLAGSTMPRGRRLPQREAPGDTAMRARTGAPAPTRYQNAPPRLPPGPPEWARGMARHEAPVQRMQKPGFPIGPGGVLNAPPPPPEGPATPEPTRYRSMQEAQLANAMMAEPMNPLPDALMAMPEPAGYASGVQSNGMRVPPAPASFGDPGATAPGMGLFGKRPGELTDDRWARALESAQAAAGKRPVTLQDQLFAAIIGGGRRNARR